VGLLTDNGVHAIFHYAPLHYLVFIARIEALLSKPALREMDFAESHFRSTSSRQDVNRGFEEYVHLTLDDYPRILQAKLCAGFPHLELSVPASEIETGEFHLCRYNIAKTRYLLGGKQSPPESPETGRYYDGKRIPIAKTRSERQTLFNANFGINMIEVLIPQRLNLPPQTTLTVFHEEDMRVAQNLIRATDVTWELRLCCPGRRYRRNAQYASAVQDFIDRALADPNWRGNGLEFDRV
jgi:hypothetical protein